MKLEAIVTATAATMLIGGMAYANEVQGKVNRIANGVDDRVCADNTLARIVDKRLTYKSSHRVID